MKPRIIIAFFIMVLIPLLWMSCNQSKSPESKNTTADSSTQNNNGGFIKHSRGTWLVEGRKDDHRHI